MASDWKKKHANDAEKAVYHPLTEETIDELMFNLGNYGVRKNDALVRMGLHKVAAAAAQVARAQLLGFDPDLLRLSSDEADEQILKMARMAVEEGKPVIVVETGHRT